MSGTPKTNTGEAQVEQYLTTIEAAAVLRLSPKTLERMRVDGSGPVFLKAGPGLRARVLYRRSDLVEWLEGFTYGSTSEIDIAKRET